MTFIIDSSHVTSFKQEEFVETGFETTVQLSYIQMWAVWMSFDVAPG